MEHQKNPINNNPNNNHQAENSASTSNTNPVKNPIKSLEKLINKVDKLSLETTSPQQIFNERKEHYEKLNKELEELKKKDQELRSDFSSNQILIFFPPTSHTLSTLDLLAKQIKENSDQITQKKSEIKEAYELVYGKQLPFLNILSERIINFGSNQRDIKLEKLQEKALLNQLVSYNYELVGDQHKLKNEVKAGLDLVMKAITSEKEAAQRQIWELNQEKEKIVKEASDQLADKDKKLKENKKELEDLKAAGVEEIKKTANWKRKQEEVLQEKTKAIESKERVELTEIRQKYEAELQKAQTQEQEIVVKNQALSDYIRLVNQQELRIEILKGEWAIASGGERELSLTKSLLQADYNSLQTELNSEKRERQTELNSKNREIETWTIKFDTEKHENEQKHQEILKKILEIRDKNNEIIDLETEKTRLTESKIQLENEKAELTTDRNEWKEKAEKAELRARVGLLANVLQGAMDYLPVPKKWQELGKHSIQAGSVYLIIKNLPGWTYEGLIALITLIFFFALRSLKRRFWEKKKISNLEKALENIILKKDSPQAVKQTTSKKILKKQAKEQEEEAEEEEEEIFEVESKKTVKNFSRLPKKPKVLRSNTKAKPKSNTK